MLHFIISFVQNIHLRLLVLFLKGEVSGEQTVTFISLLAMLRFFTATLFLSVVLIAPTATAQSFLAGSGGSSTETSSAAITSGNTPTQAQTLPEAPDDSTTEHSAQDRWDALPSRIEAHVGAGSGSFKPYERESTVYRMPPPIRHNRVEGLVLGLRRLPLQLPSKDRARVHGQFAYALALKDLRYSVGLESRLYSTKATGLKIGGLYQKQTLTADRWKTSYLENSLASFGFRHDYFDYYEAEGVTLYGIHTLPSSIKLSGGIRSEVHRSLSRQTYWSLFGNGTSSPNPSIDPGRMHSVFGSVTADHVTNLDDLPTGSAFRVSATVTNRPNASLSFARYEADGRLYLPLTFDTRLALRMRGGYATSQTPLQSQFTLGGIGSVRSYAQNRFRGTRMLLANAEYLIDGATIFEPILDDLFLAGLLDAGWIGDPNDRPHVDDVLPSAGVGVGLDERRIRLDISWPLRELPGARSGPSLWLRITPNF